MDYNSYLEIDQLLMHQKPVSETKGRKAHDEMLFIVIHQTYELWFKQIITELSSILSIFNKEKVNEGDMGIIVHRLKRIVEVQKVLIQQVDILETMTAMDFLEFRDLIFPASGFQSLQFRLIENLLGLKEQHRLTYNDLPYYKHFNDKEAEQLKSSEKSKSLFESVDQWLARTPFLKDEGFNFWQTYEGTVKKMLERDRSLIEQNSLLSPEAKSKSLEQTEKSWDMFKALFDESMYEDLQKNGQWRLSYTSVHAALLIQLYRDQPAFQMPFQLIHTLLDIDEKMTQWRYRHALMARRMLGTKVGTGGSSGHAYLQASTERHKIFSDFFQLNTFLIPRSELPELPATLQEQMRFSYNTNPNFKL